MNNFLPASMPATGNEFVGFIVFWVISLPFLTIPPEKFKFPFLMVAIYCGLGMLCMMIWSLAVAKGVGPLMTTGQSVTTSSMWNVSWLMMSSINQMVGGIAAGITNGSDFSRYARSWKHYLGGSVLSCFIVGVIVSFAGLVTTSAAQVIYGEVYWNPPDLLMVMMDNGNGSSRARAGVFFLSLGFGLTAMFENICGNCIAGGIDLAGLFPRYINIRRGAIITFVAAWVCQPWQLVNEAATFISVMNSFSVFLSPVMGIMAVDFYVLRKRKIRLSHLYRTHDTSYWFFHGVNWRSIPAWLCGWAPTVGGLIVTTQSVADAPRALYQLYYMAFLVGFFISAIIFWVLSTAFPPVDLGGCDEVDYYDTFTPAEAAKLGIISAESAIYGTAHSSNMSNPVLNEKFDDKKA
ncbi:hypothetical protein G7Z17_g363 [Cylindrodendrum hubeiense]|uniref:Uncharacterized protein n=1 Tax=Cylindrodendrum hubeiense TaxID=595255 RepID=A0A9P5HL51_9HYPO|nr:hypothetical protein G7Z17_g363 [Cylindrodendrum hubeiense]